MEADYLIVGQGIAGTLLAHFLLKRNKEVFVADSFNPSSSSVIAAGLFNPITGRRMVKTWEADRIFPFAERTYLELEETLGKKFYHKQDVLKLFSGEQEKSEWQKKAGSAEFTGYVVSDSEYKEEIVLQNNPYGGIRITQAGYLDMGLLISLFRENLVNEKRIADEPVQYEDIAASDNGVLWKGNKFGKIIFCEGYKAIYNPFFSWLPFVLTKGEIITILSPNLKIGETISKGIFVLPVGDDRYRIGSTYNWDTLDELSTAEARDELCRKFETLFPCSYIVTDHKAGIRPTVKDRRPFIGMHPRYPLLGIFNGLGTKGASLAPFFAFTFAEYLEGRGMLNSETDIKRYIAFFISSPPQTR